MRSVKGRDLLICHEFLGLTKRLYVYCISALISLACDNFDVEGQIMASF
jgi:hypothetical protein